MIKKLYYKYCMANPKKSAVNRYTRSKFGNFLILAFIISAGLFSMLPLIYAVVTSFKPIDELLIFPPTFFVRRPIRTTGNASLYFDDAMMIPTDEKVDMPTVKEPFNFVPVVIIAVVVIVLIAGAIIGIIVIKKKKA